MGEPMVLHEWKRFFAPVILYRGQAYYREKDVKKLEWDNGVLTALVEGTEEYHVSIRVRDGEAEEMRCSCPYAAGGAHCKHMAAVLFEAEVRNFSPAGSVWDTGGGQGSGLSGLIDSLSAEDAKALLLEAALGNCEVETAVRLFAEGKVPDRQLRAWKSAIGRMAERYIDRDGFMKYENAYSYIHEQMALLERAVPLLLGASMRMEAFELVRDVFLEVVDTALDDSYGGLSELCNACEVFWKDIAGEADERERGEMYNWFSLNAADERLGDAAETLQAVLFSAFREPRPVRNGALPDSRKAEV